MEKLLSSPESTLIIPEREVKDSTYIEKVNKFVETLKKKV
jgi:hypothetical protein